MQNLAHRSGRGHIQAGQRLVEQQHVGFGRQCAGKRDALRLSAGQLARHAIRQVGGVDLAEPVRRRGTGIDAREPPANAPMSTEGERHIAPDAQMREQQRVLQQQPDATVVGRHLDPRRRVGQRALAYPHYPAVGPHQPGDDVQVPSTCPRRSAPALPAPRPRRP